MMKAWKPGRRIHLETQRFNLVSATRLEAAWHTYAWASDREVTGPLGFPNRKWTLYSWYKQHRNYNNRRKFCFLIRPKSSTKAIGYESFEISFAGTAILTVAIGDRSWGGRNVVMETRKAVLKFLFEQTNCRRAWGNPCVRNLPSVFNYQALGFKSEGILRGHGVDPETGRPLDHIVFGLLRDEWLSLQDQPLK
jgi:RimJ/RimL family protein N-acetyltransferase